MNGKAHATVSMVAALPTAAAIALSTQDPVHTVLGLIGCLAGILLTPDLDLNNAMPWAVNRARNFSYTFFIIYLAIWWPYRKLVPHRSWVSHGYFIGTIIRVIYVAWPAFLVWGLDLVASPHFLFFFLGLLVSDSLHILADRWVWRIRRIWEL